MYFQNFSFSQAVFRMDFSCITMSCKQMSPDLEMHGFQWTVTIYSVFQNSVGFHCDVMIWFIMFQSHRTGCIFLFHPVL